MKFGILSQSSLRGPRVCRGGRSNPGFSAYLLLFTSLLSPALVFATPQVPRTIVFQGILVDAGGNPLTDVPSANANISIVDGAGETRYEEQQNITIYQGATAFLVGMGINPDTGELTGGIPLDVMEPGEGDLILKIKIEGQTIAQEDVIFASVPFSFYSQYATELTQQIESDQIKDGAITVSHLSEEVTTYVKSLGVSKEELEEHKTEKAAHTGRNIAVENTFKNLMGTDLQMLLESVDYNISLANKASEITTGSIDSDDIKDGDVKQVDLDMSTFNGWDKNETDDLTASTVFGGALNGVYSDLQLADNSVNTNNIVDGAVNTEDIADVSVTAEKLAESYVKKSGDTIEGDLTIQGNITFYGPNVATSNPNDTKLITITELPQIKSVYTKSDSVVILTDLGSVSECEDDDGNGLWSCVTSVSCNSYDKLLSCNGYYTGSCSGSDIACTFQGAYPAGRTCSVAVGIRNLDIETSLYVTAICGEIYK